MLVKKDWTRAEVMEVFKSLGIDSGKSDAALTVKNSDPIFNDRSNEIILTRLSDSSNPPPTGSIIDAHLERFIG